MFEATDLTYRNLELVGPPRYDEAAKEFGRAIQRNLGLAPMAEPFPAVYERLTPPQEYEANLRTLLPEWQRNFTSDDYVEYTWHAPTVRLFTGRPQLKPPHAGYEYPTWAYNAMGGLLLLVIPTNVLLIAGLGLARVGFDKYIRFVLPLVGILTVIILAVLILGVAVS